MDIDAEKILLSQIGQQERLREIVNKAILEEKLVLDNLLHPTEDIITRGQDISDKVARFGGSWKFIISFFIILSIWIAFNVVATQQLEFDPYPFILMNLILSCIAALQAPIIMMSQNRQEEKDRKRSENDYVINLKSELEIRTLHQKMNLLIEEQLRVLIETQARQLNLLKNIEQKLTIAGLNPKSNIS